MEKYDNHYNSNLQMASKSCGKQQFEEEKLKNDNQFELNEEYKKNQSQLLDCRVYLFEEHESSSSSPRIALVFHFNRLFDITIEGVVVNGHITNLERLGLPEGNGQYFYLSEPLIKCKPYDIVNYASKGNKLNGSQMLNPRDWAYQALTALGLDDLVLIINQGNYKVSGPPEVVPPTSFYGGVKNKLSGFFGSSKNDPPVRKKGPVEIPKITDPHVPSEYESKERYAVVILYISGDIRAIIFHFEGDDSFRTVQGIWHEGELKPSFKKERPPDESGNYFELGRIETSPLKVRDLTLENACNGAKKDSGLSETDWAKLICDKVGLIDNWSCGIPWKYVQPPQYTVAPARTVFLMPTCGSSESSTKY